MTVQKMKKQPMKSAAFGGRLLVLFWGLKYSNFLEVQNDIYTYWVYLMESIFFRGLNFFLVPAHVMLSAQGLSENREILNATFMTQYLAKIVSQGPHKVPHR